MNPTYPECTYAHVDLLSGNGCLPAGCVLKDGKLSRSFNAVNTMKTPVANLVCLYYSNFSGASLAYSSDGKVYKGSNLDATVLTEIKSLSASSPFYIEQRKGRYADLVLMTNSDYVRMRNGSYYSEAVSASLRCGTVRCGRIFGIDLINANLLKWSGEDGYDDWEQGISGAGQVYLDSEGGQAWNVFNFEDELIVMRNNGITRMAVAGNPENFRFENFTITMPALYKNTAAVVGDSLFFCANGGMYVYKGGRISKVKGLISDDIVNPNLCFSYAGRYYMVAGNSTRLSRRVVYMYDTVDGTYQIVDIPATCLAADVRSLIGITSNAIYRIQLTGEYNFTCGTYDFGSNKRKLLTTLEADCDSGVYVKISNGRFTKTVAAGGTVRLNMRGAKFTVSVTGTGEVRSMKLNAEVRK